MELKSFEELGIENSGSKLGTIDLDHSIILSKTSLAYFPRVFFPPPSRLPSLLDKVSLQQQKPERPHASSPHTVDTGGFFLEKL